MTDVDRDPEIVEIFVAESLEALDRLESLLIEAEGGSPQPDMLDVLFRDIHTIKGTSGYLSFDRILSISHVGEDLLDKLRSEALAPIPAHFACLMEVGDVLRLMLGNISEQEDEGEVEVGHLVDQIKRFLEGEGQPGADAPADAPAPEPAPAEAAEASSAEPEPAEPASVETPAAAETPSTTASAAAEASDASEPKPKGKEPQKPSEVTSDGSVRVNVRVLDRLMNLMGELVLARNQIVQLMKTSDGTVSGQSACQRLSLVTSDIQEQIMKTRMQPVARVFERIPRMVRDLCKQTEKRARTQIDGTATEIDKALVEAIRDPVMHVVRNAIDHGLESPEERVAKGKPALGTLSVKASHEGGMVSIEIGDDGKGLDPAWIRQRAIEKGLLTPTQAERLNDREILECVFRPGFSTASQVTDISGRGVGMDVVRTRVERAGGQVELDSTPGKGTTIRFRMPLTLAIIPALLVRSCGQRFAIPQVNLLELVYLDDEQAQTAIEHVRGAAIYRLRGEILPVVRLSEVLNLKPRERAEDDGGGVNIVVMAIGNRRYGLLVDEIHDTEEIVIKPLHGELKRVSSYAGATVLGDGGVALILDASGLAEMAGIDTSSGRNQAAEEATDAGASGPVPYLVFLAGDGSQCAVPLAMVARLEQIQTRAIESAAGQEVVQYRDEILPIVRPEQVLPLGQSAPREEQQLVLFDFGQLVGMAVNEIRDVVDVVVPPGAARGAVPFALGREVILGKTTLLLDVYSIVRNLVPNFAAEAVTVAPRTSRVLLADDSNAMRCAVSDFLRSTGLEVVDVSSGDDAVRELRASGMSGFDAVITDLEMGGTGGLGVIAEVQRERPELPVIVWTHRAGEDIQREVLEAGARAYVNKLRREDLVAALHETGLILSAQAA